MVEDLFRDALADVGGGLSARRQSAGSRALCSPTARSPTPMTASCARPKAPAATASKQIERARKMLVAGLCRRGDRQILPHAGGHGHQRRAPSRRAHRRRHGALAADDRSAGDARIRPLHRLQVRRLEPGPGDAPAARVAEAASISTASIRPARISSTRWSNARSSLTPTAISSMAIRNSSRCRSKRCCPTPTTPSAASWSATTASLEQRPGTIKGFGKQLRAARRRRRAHKVGRRGRADRRQALDA